MRKLRPQRFFLCFSFILFTVAAYPLTLEGRLPGDYFREDNPPRFGAVMSFVSRLESTILLHVISEKPEFTIAKQLGRIARGLKIRPEELEKTRLIEGELRWLQYTFHKKKGGGFVYITRRENRFIYLVIFNMQYEALSRDLPHIDRYIQQLQIKETNDE